MSVGEPGLYGAFAKTEDDDFHLHFTNIVKDTEGKGGNLIQYSFIKLKQDASHWLRENGRLPSTDIDEYFEEIRQMKKQQKEIELLKEKQKTHDAEIYALKT